MAPKTRKGISWIEIPIFIHGMTPRGEAHAHKADYDNLFQLVNRELDARGKLKLQNPVSIEWGWDSGQSKQPDKYLDKAEEKIWQNISPAIAPRLNPLLSLYRWARSIMTFAVGDMFYYASADGETALRNHVFEYLAKHIQEKAKGAANISLSIFAHSGGSLVMHDLLYHIYGKKNPEESEGKALFKIMEPIRALAKKRLRVRRFYTFGSPIHSLSLRSNTLMVEKIIKRKSLYPKDIGLIPYADLKNARWINFWSRFDIFSYPVTPLYFEDKHFVEDRDITNSIWFPKSHSAYWSSKKMAAMIAENY